MYVDALVRFLRARITEDQEAAYARIDAEVERLRRDGLPDTTRHDLITMEESDHWRRPIAEAEAKRLVLEAFDRDEWCIDGGHVYMDYALQAMATVYAGHPDYDRDAWAREL